MCNLAQLSEVMTVMSVPPSVGLSVGHTNLKTAQNCQFRRLPSFCNLLVAFPLSFTFIHIHSLSSIHAHIH